MLAESRGALNDELESARRRVLQFHRPVTAVAQTSAMGREIVVPGVPDEILEARQQVLQYLEECGCPDDCAFEIGMAVQQALANAVLHGCKSDPRLKVTVEVSCDDSEALVIVRDPGSGFDPSQVRDPGSRDGQLCQSGRGIEMMKAYMDDVAFTGGGREVRMQKSWRRLRAQSA